MDSKTAQNTEMGGSKSPLGDELQQEITLGSGVAAVFETSIAPVKKQFTIVTIISLAFVICNSWAGVAISVQLALLEGGPATLIYTILLSTIAYFCIAASLAELASVYPTSGGQYHFASILAPEKLKRVSSYSCGLLAIFSWIAIGAAVTIVPGQQITAIVAALHPNYVTKQWHIFLIYEAVALWVMLVNVFALKRNPWTHNIGFALTITLFFVYLIGFAVRSEKAPNEFVWRTFINYTGWPGGVCFLVGMSTSCFMYGGIDAALHMAEECLDAARVVPRAVMCTILIGFLTAFPYTVVLLYGITDIDTVLTGTEYIPLLLATQGFRSQTAAIVLTVAGIVLSFFVLNAIQETSSRLAWAFARDNGLVLSKYFQRIHPKWQVPVESIVLTYAILAICGCIFVASTTAFNALIGSSVVLQQLSFLIPNALLLYQRRSEHYLPRDRPFYLPPVLGYMVNTFVVVYSVTTFTFFNLPAFMPTSASTMNYTCVILGIAGFLGLINWFLHARKHYRGPTIVFR